MVQPRHSCDMCVSEGGLTQYERAPLLCGSLELLEDSEPTKEETPYGTQVVGLDGHQSSTVAAVHDEQGKSPRESILATEAEALGSLTHGTDG